MLQKIASSRLNLYVFFASLFIIFLRFQEPGINFDSALYATIARNFSERLDWFNLSFSAYLFPEFHAHPPMAMWLQGLIFKVLGASDATARLLNSVCGVLIVVLTFRLGSLVLNTWCGLAASFILLLSYQFLYASATFLLDVSHAFWCLLALFLFFRSLSERGSMLWNGIGMSLCFSFALMSKGIFAFAPMATVGLYSLVAPVSRKRKMQLILSLVASLCLPMLYFYLQAKMGLYPYLKLYLHDIFFTQAQKNMGGLQFGLLKTFFVGYAPWSWLFPVSLVTLWQYGKRFRFHHFTLIYTFVTFFFFAFSSKTLGHYLLIFVPVMSLSVATLLYGLKEKNLMPDVATLSKGMLGLSILVLFFGQVYPGPVRLSSAPDYYGAAAQVQQLKQFRINSIYCLQRGFDFYAVRMRGQWYWDVPIDVHPEFKAYQALTNQEKDRRALLVHSDIAKLVEGDHPEVFKDLVLYFRTKVFSFYVPKRLSRLPASGSRLQKTMKASFLSSSVFRLPKTEDGRR